MEKIRPFGHIAGGGKLAKWRENEGLTQFRLAVLINITPSTLSKIETGDRLPPLEMCAKIQIVTNDEVAVESWIDWDAVKADIAKRLPS